MKRIFALALIAVMVFSMAACGGGGGTQVTGDVVSASIPSGWCMVSGTEMFGQDSCDFICHSKEYELGDAYMQIATSFSDYDSTRAAYADSAWGDPVEFTVNGITWSGADLGICADIGGTVVTVACYNVDFNDKEVQEILGTIALK